MSWVPPYAHRIDPNPNYRQLCVSHHRKPVRNSNGHVAHARRPEYQYSAKRSYTKCLASYDIVDMKSYVPLCQLSPLTVRGRAFPETQFVRSIYLNQWSKTLSFAPTICMCLNLDLIHNLLLCFGNSWENVRSCGWDPLCPGKLLIWAILKSWNFSLPKWFRKLFFCD